MTEPTGKAKGGAARAASLTPERRKEIAMRAVQAKKDRAAMPKVTHEGVLKILDIELPCYVLASGQNRTRRSEKWTTTNCPLKSGNAIHRP